jgi:hypothetical protein
MNIDKLRRILNMIFMLGALVSIIGYFVVEDKKIFLYICGATLFVKFVEIIIRVTNR